jgi:hypothetical protein
VSVEDIKSQFHHAPIAVPKHENPFTDKQHLQMFADVAESVVNENILPYGFNVREDEWDDDGYPSVEILRSGRRGLKEQRIALPIETWLPRARLWVQMLVVMNEVLEEQSASRR